MIKAQQYHREHPESRIDALALVLGFKFENGEYVPTKVVRQKRKYTRRQVVAAPVHAGGRPRGTKKKRGVPFSRETSADIRTLDVGGHVDLTNFVHLNNITFKSIRQRARNFQHEERQKGRTGILFRAIRQNGSVLIRRIA